MGTCAGERAAGGWQVPAGQILGCAAVLQRKSWWVRGGAGLVSMPEEHTAA